MKAVLDHVGIAVRDLDAALAFFRDALGLEVGPAEDVASQRVRAYHIPTGEAGLELLGATDQSSPIARYLEKRGPGLHHITLRVDDLEQTLTQLTGRGVKLIDERPRIGAGGSRIAFIHPSSAHGVLVELKEAAGASTVKPAPNSSLGVRNEVRRLAFGDFELVSLFDGFFRLDGGAMFGVVPKPLWERVTPPDERNRITLAMRPLLVRGRRTLLIDAGAGEKTDPTQAEFYGLDRPSLIEASLAEAGLGADSIDIVLATHLHFDHAGGFTVRDGNGRLRPRFPRAQYIVRRGEWEEAHAQDARSRASYRRDDFEPLAEAGVLQLVDDDSTIMPGVKVRRTGGHTMHHQMVEIRSGRQTAAFVGDLMPTTAHLRESWIMSYDLFPVDTLAYKHRFIREAIEGEYLVVFEHDEKVAGGYIREVGDKPRVDVVW